MALQEYRQSIQHDQSLGERYLRAYGCLQCIFVQQDALGHLCEALELPFALPPEIRAIREDRNDSIGHPTKRGAGDGARFHFLTQRSLSPSGFDLVSVETDGDFSIRRVDIQESIDRQLAFADQVKNRVLQHLETEKASR